MTTYSHRSQTALRSSEPGCRLFKDVLVVGALVHILETSPAADIVDQQGSEIGPLRFDIGHRPVQAFPASDVQAASPMVRVNLHDFHVVVRRVLANDVCLVLGRVLLVLIDMRTY